jgi:hypothetical protein
MSRISIVMSTAILAVLVLPVHAAEQTLKQQVQGAWNLVSCDARTSTGATPISTSTCVNPSGSFSLHGNGRYTIILAAKGRPTAQRENVTPEAYKAITTGFAANFGTWSVNEADKTVTLHAEEELFPRPGHEYKFTVVSVTADEMKTSGLNGNAVWRRFK